MGEQVPIELLITPGTRIALHHLEAPADLVSVVGEGVEGSEVVTLHHEVSGSHAAFASEGFWEFGLRGMWGGSWCRGYDRWCDGLCSSGHDLGLLLQVVGSKGMGGSQLHTGKELGEANWL